MKPHVIIYNAVSLDGRLSGFSVDLSQYYSLIARWKEDATLVGSNTILAAGEGMPAETGEPPEIAEKDPSAPLLVVPDSQGKVHNWLFLRSQPYWRDVVVLCSRSTPIAYLDRLQSQSIPYIITGENHVDLRASLEQLNLRYGVKVIRVDSGGTLNGLLLQEGLVDEVSLLLHPSIVGDLATVPFFKGSLQPTGGKAIELQLKHYEKVSDNAIWLCYDFIGG